MRGCTGGQPAPHPQCDEEWIEEPVCAGSGAFCLKAVCLFVLVLRDGQPGPALPHAHPPQPGLPGASGGDDGGHDGGSGAVLRLLLRALLQRGQIFIDIKKNSNLGLV